MLRRKHQSQNRHQSPMLPRKSQRFVAGHLRTTSPKTSEPRSRTDWFRIQAMTLAPSCANSSTRTWKDIKSRWCGKSWLPTKNFKVTSQQNPYGLGKRKTSSENCWRSMVVVGLRWREKWERKERRLVVRKQISSKTYHGRGKRSPCTRIKTSLILQVWFSQRCQ